MPSKDFATVSAAALVAGKTATAGLAAFNDQMQRTRNALNQTIDLYVAQMEPAQRGEAEDLAKARSSAEAALLEIDALRRAFLAATGGFDVFLELAAGTVRASKPTA